MGETTENHFTAVASENFVGKKIKRVRYLTRKEAGRMGWHHRSIMLILEDGTMLFPSRDDEGNDAGALFGQTPTGEELTIPVM